MKNKKVVITDEWFMIDEAVDDEHLAHLGCIAEVVRKVPVSEEEMVDCIRDADGVMLSDFPLPGSVIEKSERLKIISRVGVGYNNVDIPAATKKRIIVTNVPGALSDSVAEHTILLMLSVARRLIVGNDFVRNGRWTDFIKCGLGSELNGKTLGLIGFGAIGDAVSRRAAAFNMRMLVYDPYVPADRITKLGYESVELNRLLRESDVVSIHTPLTPETKMMIGERELKMMKKSAILINTARGDVIDESSLFEALRQRRILGAGLDVMSLEPPRQGHPLFGLDNVILTPHSACAHAGRH